MAKKDKNSLLNIHYSRTMTADNLSKAANYVGEYFLKGLGALGKIFTTPLTGGPLGPTTVVLPKTKKLLDSERKLRETQEELIGKAMTWVSPLNYGAALVTGNGLNAKKGEEEVASWSPAWQAIGRLGELYVGPKAVKGVKSAPRVVVNTAAKAGSKTAKKVAVAKEINSATKLGVQSINLRPRILTYDLLANNYGFPKSFKLLGAESEQRAFLGDDGYVYKIPKYGASDGTFVTKNMNINRLPNGLGAKTEFLGIRKNPNGTKTPIIRLEYVEPIKSRLLYLDLMKDYNYDDQFHFILFDDKGLHAVDDIRPSNVGTINGKLKIFDIGAYETPKNIQKPVIKTTRQEPSTSLAFFERKPSKISEAEKFGLNKHDRKALSINEQLALEDLALYKNSGLYRQVFRVTPDWEEFGWNLDRSNPTFMLLFVADGKTMKGPFARVLLLTPTGKGVVSWNPEKNMGGYSSRSFVTPEGLKYAPGEANMMLEGPNLKVILTSPRVDIQDFMDDLTTGSVEDLALFKSLDSQLKRTIDKDIMKDFWINSRKVQRPGSYMSGDNGRAPLGSTLIEAFKKRQLHKTPVLERPMSLLVVRRTGVSPDSYSSIIRQGNRDGSLRWGEGFTKWNNSAVENKFINDAFEQLKRGEITPEQYEGIFNKWSLEIGGRPLLWTTIQGLKIPVHPHPYIYAKKQGGKMNILEFLKNGGQVRKMQTAAGGPLKKRIKRLKDGYRYIPDERNGEWDRISDNEMSDIFATYVVKGKDKRADVRIDKKSEDFDRKFKYDETEIPFIKDKEITLTNAGLYTGAKLSTNLLDSIAKYAKNSGLPLKTAVGLVAKETSLGNPTVDSSLKKLAGDGFAYQLAKALNGGLHINEGKALNPKDLINFHYEELNPYLGLKNIAYKKSVGNMDDYGREGPFGDEGFLKRYRELLKLGENYSDNLAKKLLSNFNPNKNVLQAGFEFYKLNPRKYNYNQTNYPLLVEERGNMVYNSPEFKSWLSTSEYKKQGGKMNILEFLKNGGLIRKMLTASGGPIKKSIKRLKDGYRYIPDEENGGWDRISDNSMADVFATMEFTPKKTNVGSSITRTLQPKTSNYRSAYNPDDIIKGFNTLTLGGLNNLSPTLWARRAYDIGKFLTGNMTLSGLTNSWLNGNNGLVSLKFAEEHPYISTGINLVGDAITLGGVVKGNKILFRTSKPKINVLANSSSTSSVSLTPSLSLEQIEKAFELARLWHLNRINSPGYTNRALRAGFTEEEIPLLQLLLTSLINRLKLFNPEELFGKINMKHNYNGKASAGYWKTVNNDGKLLLGIRFDNPNMSYDDAVSTFVHEFGHGATFGLNGNETTGYMKLLSDLFPLLTRAVKYNKTLYPEVNENIVTQVMPKVGNNARYYADPTEMLSRGYEFMRDYANNFFKLKNSDGLTTQKVIDNAANTRINSKIFRALTGNLGAFNFLKYALGTAAPIGLGYGLMNNNENQLQLQYQKLGGKMNILEFLKNGSGIHIKPSKRGSFTRWCGGNVTEECIRRGKNSPNAAIRKKATFADNARHFKHKKGGKAFVNGVNVLDSNPKMSKAASRRVKKHLYGGDINNSNAMGGTAFTSWINYQMRLPELLKLKEEKKQQELLLEQLKLIEKSEKLNSILGTVSNFGYLALGKLLNNKPASKVDNGSPSKTIFNLVVANNFQNGNQFTGGTSMNNYLNYFNTTLTKPTI